MHHVTLRHREKLILHVIYAALDVSVCCVMGDSSLGKRCLTLDKGYINYLIHSNQSEQLAVFFRLTNSLLLPTTGNEFRADIKLELYIFCFAYSMGLF